MNLRNLILAFLSARSPASFSAEVIHARVSQSGFLDKAVTVDEVAVELRTLASAKMNALVNVDIHPVTKGESWWATDSGVKQWTLDGRINVGG